MKPYPTGIAGHYGYVPRGGKIWRAWHNLSIESETNCCHSSVKNNPREEAKEGSKEGAANLRSQSLIIAQSQAVILHRVSRSSASLRVSDGSQGSLRVHKTVSAGVRLLQSPLLHQLCLVACGIVGDQPTGTLLQTPAQIPPVQWTLMEEQKQKEISRPWKPLTAFTLPPSYSSNLGLSSAGWVCMVMTSAFCGPVSSFVK